MSSRKLALLVRNQNPLVLGIQDSMQHACRCMADRGVGAVLVTDAADRLRGIFTGRDVVRVMQSSIDPARTTLAEVMTPNPKTLSPESTTIEALRAMHDGRFRHMPVIGDGKILGVVSRADFTGEEFERFDYETYLWEHI